MKPRFAIALAFVLAGGCKEDAPPAAPPVTGHVELVEAPPSGDVAAYVAHELELAARDDVPLLVYVGATWCEPCRDFHAAADKGELDAQLGALRLLEFDLDRDGDRLEAAGYKSPLVPLFAKPAADGRASGQQTDGVRKGGQYVDQLVPRVKALASS